MKLSGYQVPFCDSQLECLHPEEGAVVLWKCLPDVCQQRLEGFTALLLTLAMLTTVFNGVVLLANLLPSTRRMLQRNPTMQNYSTYVVSMALADMLMGAVLLPTIVSYFYLEMTSPRQIEFFTNVTLHDEDMLGYSFPVSWVLSKVNTTHIANQTSTPNETFSNSSSLILTHEDRSRLETMMYIVGALTHLVIFVSMYTLAAASADRFYTSRKPISSRSIKLTSSSFRLKNRFALSDGSSQDHCINVKGSTVVVVVIWMLGIFISMIPLFLYPDLRFDSIGHVFVIFTSKRTSTGTLFGYALFLGLPLLVTWIFSVLICITLWRRKQRLKNSYSSARANNGGRGSSIRRSQRRNRRNKQLNHFSMTESHVTASVIDRPLAAESEYALEESIKLVGNTAREISPSFPCLDETTMSNIEESVEEQSKRRPSSLDLNLIKKLSESEHNAETKMPPVSLPANSEFFPLDTLHKPEDNFVSKRLLLRRSWGGCTEETKLSTSSFDNCAQIPKVMPVTRQISEVSTAAQIVTPAPSLKTPEWKNDCAARPSRASTRMRRKSSVFRAREFIRSKTFESNIAKTLCAVVVAITIAVLPLLVVLISITVEGEKFAFQVNENVSNVVATMAILFSNSLWNCLIYGVRMPYFRRAISRLFRRSLNQLKATYCGRRYRSVCKNMRRKFRRSPSRSSARALAMQSRDDLSDSIRSKIPNNSREEYSQYVMRPQAS